MHYAFIEYSIEIKRFKIFELSNEKIPIVIFYFLCEFSRPLIIL